jgi:SAM-dependent methyltransferase
MRTYDEVAREYLENTSARSRLDVYRRRFAERLATRALVLDVGCGPGGDSLELRALGLGVVGLDLSLGMLRATPLARRGPRVQADMLELPVADARVDGVWANACLLHLAPELFARALAELHRVLVPGGIVYCSVKAGDGGAWETERYGRPRWFWYWSAPELDAAWAEAGFRTLGAWEMETRERWHMRLLEVS